MSDPNAAGNLIQTMMDSGKTLLTPAIAGIGIAGSIASIVAWRNARRDADKLRKLLETTEKEVTEWRTIAKENAQQKEEMGRLVEQHKIALADKQELLTKLTAQCEKMEPLKGDIEDFFAKMTELLGAATSTVEQMTISPALFHSMRRRDYFEKYKLLIREALEREVGVCLYHVEERHLAPIFNLWAMGDSAAESEIDARYREMIHEIALWSQWNKRLLRKEVRPLRRIRFDREATAQSAAPRDIGPLLHPVPFLVAFANRRNHDRKMAIMSLFNFDQARGMEQSDFQGFVTRDPTVVAHLGEMFDRYVRVMECSSGN